MATVPRCSNTPMTTPFPEKAEIFSPINCSPNVDPAQLDLAHWAYLTENELNRLQHELNRILPPHSGHAQLQLKNLLRTSSLPRPDLKLPFQLLAIGDSQRHYLGWTVHFIKAKCQHQQIPVPTPAQLKAVKLLGVEIYNLIEKHRKDFLAWHQNGATENGDIAQQPHAVEYLPLDKIFNLDLEKVTLNPQGQTISGIEEAKDESREPIKFRGYPLWIDYRWQQYFYYLPKKPDETRDDVRLYYRHYPKGLKYKFRFPNGFGPKPLSKRDLQADGLPFWYDDPRYIANPYNFPPANFPKQVEPDNLGVIYWQWLDEAQWEKYEKRLGEIIGLENGSIWGWSMLDQLLNNGHDNQDPKLPWLYSWTQALILRIFSKYNLPKPSIETMKQIRGVASAIYSVFSWRRQQFLAYLKELGIAIFEANSAETASTHASASQSTQSAQNSISHSSQQHMIRSTEEAGHNHTRYEEPISGTFSGIAPYYDGNYIQEIHEGHPVYFDYDYRGNSHLGRRFYYRQAVNHYTGATEWQREYLSLSKYSRKNGREWKNFQSEKREAHQSVLQRLGISI